MAGAVVAGGGAGVGVAHRVLHVPEGHTGVEGAGAEGVAGLCGLMCSADAIPAARARRRTRRQAAVRSRRWPELMMNSGPDRALVDVGLECSHDGRGEGSGGSFAGVPIDVALLESQASADGALAGSSPDP